MKLLNIDGSEFGDAPAWLADRAPAVGQAFVIAGDIAFVHLSHGLRFYAARDRDLWVAGEPR